MHKVLVSRCLLGERVRFDGNSKGSLAMLDAWRREGRVVPVCPEVAGGLPVPRPPAEIPGGQGALVLDGVRRVLARTGADVTDAFLAGARAALALVETHGIRVAVLKARSPSCGNRQTYDGTFRGHLVAGEGVAAALLERHGVKVFSEEELEAAAAELAALDAADRCLGAAIRGTPHP